MEIQKKIQQVLEEDINVKLVLHDGSARLTSYEDGVARIKFTGACASCMSQTDTFDSVVKAIIMEKVPEVRDVIVDDTVSDELLDFARKILAGEIR